MPLASGAFIQDRGTTMMQVAAFPAGYSNDGIFGYDDGINKWIAIELDSLISCRKGGIYSNGVDMTTKLNTLLSNSGIKGIRFDAKGGGGITVNGTVNVPSGKVLSFENGCYLTGSGTVNGGIIDGNFRSKIFDITLTIVPEALVQGKWSVRWFGALGNNSQDDQPSIQKTIDSAITSNLKYVYMPFGIYKISKGIVIRKGTDVFCTGFKLEGEVSVYGGEIGQTKISTSNKNTFMVGVHKGKGVRISNIYLSGANISIATLSIYDVMENPNTDFTGGCRNTPSSPHAGFIVDPFVNDPSYSDQYPDFTSYYVNEGSGGSTDIIFENCRVNSLVVGYCMSPHTTPQNGDAICINNCWGDSCKAAISVGQSQNRSMLVNNFKCWGHTETIFDSYNYGNVTSDHPEVDGLNVAGSVRYLCRLTTFANKGLIIKRAHIESLYMLNGPGQLGDLCIKDSRIHLQSTQIGTPAIHDAYTVFKGGSLKISDSLFIRYSNYNKPFAVDCAMAYFERCYFEILPINYATATGGQIFFENCRNAQTIHNFGTDGRITLTKTADQSPNNPILFLSNMELSFISRNRYAPANGTWSYTRKRMADISDKFLSRDYNFFALKSSTLNFSSIDSVNLTANIIIGLGDDYNKVMLDDLIFLNGTTNILDEYGIANRYLCCGMVTAKNDITGTITLSYTTRGIDNITNYNFYIGRTSLMYPFCVVGDCASGSNLITNAVADGGLSTPKYISVNSPYFPIGTYITSISGTTITCSNNAISSGTNIDVVSANWQAIEYGVYNAATPDVIGYKSGDLIYNTNPVTYPNVWRWRCIQSGVTATSRLPIFTTETAIPANSLEATFSSTNNTTFVIPIGYLTTEFVLKSTVNMTISIGTTPSGTDIANSQATVANISIVIPYVKYTDNSITIYFTGISGGTLSIIPILRKV